MPTNSVSLPAGFAEVRLKGKTTLVPSVEIEGRTVIVTGKWLKLAAIREQNIVNGDLVKDPDSFVRALKSSALRADVLTFFQRPPDVVPKFKLHFDWDN